eukprot:356496-Chlamydomonas_euryale.AAC.9
MHAERLCAWRGYVRRGCAYAERAHLKSGEKVGLPSCTNPADAAPPPQTTRHHAHLERGRKRGPPVLHHQLQLKRWRHRPQQPVLLWVDVVDGGARLEELAQLRQRAGHEPAQLIALQRRHRAVVRVGIAVDEDGRDEIKDLNALGRPRRPQLRLCGLDAAVDVCLERSHTHRQLPDKVGIRNVDEHGVGEPRAVPQHRQLKRVGGQRLQRPRHLLTRCVHVDRPRRRQLTPHNGRTALLHLARDAQKGWLEKERARERRKGNGGWGAGCGQRGEGEGRNAAWAAAAGLKAAAAVSATTMLS